MTTPDSDANDYSPQVDSGTSREAGGALHGVDLAEALRLLRQAGIRIAPDNQPAALQQVIDALCTLSSQDGLTGLANRRVFNDTLRRQIDRSTRTGEIFGLLLIDIDHFK